MSEQRSDETTDRVKTVKQNIDWDGGAGGRDRSVAKRSDESLPPH